MKSVRSHFKLGNFDSFQRSGQEGRACLVEMGKKMEAIQSRLCLPTDVLGCVRCNAGY